MSYIKKLKADFLVPKQRKVTVNPYNIALITHAKIIHFALGSIFLQNNSGNVTL